MSGVKEITPFEAIGGEPAVRRLADRFYDLMESNPNYAHIREMHPPSMEGSRDKFFWFLCGWLGGPEHYVERFGHPRLRARHMPFAIGLKARDQWLACMFEAMDAELVEPWLKERLQESFFRTADFMRNQGG